MNLKYSIATNEYVVLDNATFRLWFTPIGNLQSLSGTRVHVLGPELPNLTLI